MVDLAEIQAAYYMVAATGVLVAAGYYIQNLRTNEKIKRRDLVFQRLQASQIQFYEAYLSVYMLEWKNYEDFRSRYYGKVEQMSKVYFILSHFNALGILYKDGIADLDQIFQLYTPTSIITMYELLRPEILAQRISWDYPHIWGEVSNPDNYMPFEQLYKEAKRRYPKIVQGSGGMDWAVRKVEMLEPARRIDEMLAKESSN
jgi:hypothetical protein